MRRRTSRFISCRVLGRLNVSVALLSRCGGGGGGLSNKLGVYNSAAVSTPSTTPVQATWVYQLGDALLDLTTPNQPSVVTQGVYFIGMSFSGGGTWTVGAAMQGKISCTHGGGCLGIDFPTADILDRRPRGFAAITTPISPGDSIFAFLDNRDTANRDVEMDSVTVCLIGTF